MLLRFTETRTRNPLTLALSPKGARGQDKKAIRAKQLPQIKHSPPSFSPTGEKVAEGRMSDGLKLVQVTDSKKDIFEFLSVWQMCFVGWYFLAETLGASPQTPGIF